MGNCCSRNERKSLGEVEVAGESTKRAVDPTAKPVVLSRTILREVEVMEGLGIRSERLRIPKPIVVEAVVVEPALSAKDREKEVWSKLSELHREKVDVLSECLETSKKKKGSFGVTYIELYGTYPEYGLLNEYFFLFLETNGLEMNLSKLTIDAGVLEHYYFFLGAVGIESCDRWKYWNALDLLYQGKISTKGLKSIKDSKKLRTLFWEKREYDEPDFKVKKEDLRVDKKKNSDRFLLEDLALFEKLDIRKCSCGVKFEKNKGCRHMKCPSCGVHFCFECMKFFGNRREGFALFKIHKCNRKYKKSIPF